MRILFLLPRFHTNLYYAMQGLQRRGHELMLCCEEQAPLEDYSVVEPEVLQPQDFEWSAVFARLRAFRPDVVVARQYHGPWKRFCFAARLLSIRTLGYDQRPLHLRRGVVQRVREWLRGRPAVRFTPVRGNPALAPADAAAHYLPFPVAAAPGPRHYAPGGVVRILCVGKLTQPRKRHFLLFAALEKLKDAGTFQLTLAGSSVHQASGGDTAYYEQLLAYERDGALAGRVTIRANQAFQDMARLYLEHDLCVLPSRNEPLGTAPLEAMAHGCVPVLSDECGSAGYVDDGVHGRIFPADDAAALQRILHHFITHPEDIGRLGAAAAAHAAAEFAPQRFVDRFESVCAGL